MGSFSYAGARYADAPEHHTPGNSGATHHGVSRRLGRGRRFYLRLFITLTRDTMNPDNDLPKITKIACMLFGAAVVVAAVFFTGVI